MCAIMPQRIRGHGLTHTLWEREPVHATRRSAGILMEGDLTRTAPTTTITDLDSRLGGPGDSYVVVDLNDVEYLAHDTLLYLVGYFHQRAAQGLTTRLVLPTRSTAVDFMRAWNFPEALEAVTDDRFEFLLDVDSRQRFQNLPPVSKYERVIFQPGGGRENLLPRTFFALTALGIPLQSAWSAVRTSPRRAASMERDRWLQAHVLRVLDLYLSDRGDQVGTRVVYEAVLNAARHPKASLGMVSSQLVRARKGDRFEEPVAIQIAIWDNGYSFAKTLSDRVVQGLPIQTESYGAIDEEFDVRVLGVGGQAHESLEFDKPLKLDSKRDVVVAPDEALMVAAFMLGVTSAPERGTTVDDDIFLDGASDPAGSGLYYIRRIVVDKFGGDIKYVSGRSRMSLTAGRSKGRYHATVHTSPGFANISGNLLVVTIPVNFKPSPPKTSAARQTALTS